MCLRLRTAAIMEWLVEFSATLLTGCTEFQNVIIHILVYSCKLLVYWWNTPVYLMQRLCNLLCQITYQLPQVITRVWLNVESKVTLHSWAVYEWTPSFQISQHKNKLLRSFCHMMTNLLVGHHFTWTKRWNAPFLGRFEWRVLTPMGGRQCTW